MSSREAQTPKSETLKWVSRSTNNNGTRHIPYPPSDEQRRRRSSRSGDFGATPRNKDSKTNQKTKSSTHPRVRKTKSSTHPRDRTTNSSTHSRVRKNKSSAHPRVRKTKSSAHPRVRKTNNSAHPRAEHVKVKQLGSDLVVQRSRNHFFEVFVRDLQDGHGFRGIGAQ